MCGVFGIHASGRTGVLPTLRGLKALEHRGGECVGVAVLRLGEFTVLQKPGPVSSGFEERALGSLSGEAVIGHTGCPTGFAAPQPNLQPVVRGGSARAIALAVDGNLANAGELRRELTSEGRQVASTSAADLIATMIASDPSPLDRAVVGALTRLSGGYSLVALCDGLVLGARDRAGIRPLVLGRIHGDWVLASEPSALELIGATLDREVEPGEVIAIDRDGARSLPAIDTADEEQSEAFCVLEFASLAHPASAFGRVSTHKVRRAMGSLLAREAPVDADVVVALRDAVAPVAHGFSSESGIPLSRESLERRLESDREPGPRHLEDLAGVRVVLVDDVIVRGDRVRQCVDALFVAEASEVHVRIATPPVVAPCFYGVDIPLEDELVAAGRGVSEIREVFSSTSLGYLSLAGLEDAVGGTRDSLCEGCLTRTYATPITDARVDLDRTDPLAEGQPDQHILLVNADGSLSYLSATLGPGGLLQLNAATLRAVLIAGSYVRSVTNEVGQAFEDLLNREGARESEIQAFLEDHPEFLLGAEFDVALPQVVLPVGRGQSLRPDFVLRPIAGVTWDARIVELKLPAQRLLRRRPKHHEGIYDTINAAVRQLRAYGRFFEDEVNRTEFANEMGFVIHRPRLALVVGRTRDFPAPRQFSDWVDEVGLIDVLSYDDLILRYRRLQAARSR